MDEKMGHNEISYLISYITYFYYPYCWHKQSLQLNYTKTQAFAMFCANFTLLPYPLVENQEICSQSRTRHVLFGAKH